GGGAQANIGAGRIDDAFADDLAVREQDNIGSVQDVGQVTVAGVVTDSYVAAGRGTEIKVAVEAAVQLERTVIADEAGARAGLVQGDASRLRQQGIDDGIADSAVAGVVDGENA